MPTSLGDLLSRSRDPSRLGPHFRALAFGMADIRWRRMNSMSSTTQMMDDFLQSQRRGICHRSMLAATAAGLMLAIGTDVSPIRAQEGCCFEPAYRLECETVMQPQPVERLRLSYETKYVEEEVTSYRPVVKERVEERVYRVAKPVTETSYREERFTVYKPVVETSYREETVTNTRYVTEQAEREEKVTTMRPVTETQMVERRYTVQRPVVETQYRQQQYTVQRPVVETQMQTQQVTSYRPVTTMENRTVDAGGYVPQTTVTPGSVQYGMGWNPRAYAVPGPLGLFARVRGAPVVVPQVTPPVAQTQMVYRPNYVTQQVAKTNYVPEVQQVQRPVQVTKLQQEVVTQQVPVQVQRMQTEVVTQKVPVQTTRMVPQTVVRKIPYTVQRPVTETSTRKVPVQRKRWVAEERVRKVPVQTTRMVYETRREPVTVRYVEQEEVKRIVKRPVTVPRYEKVTEMRYVPRQVVQRLPLSYVDPFSPAIVSGYSSFAPSVQLPTPAETVDSESVDDGEVSRRRPADENGQSVLEDSDQDSDDAMQPQSRLGGVQFGDLESEQDDDSRAPRGGNNRDIDDDAESNDPRDVIELQQPELNTQETGWRTQDRAKVREVHHPIRWNPVYAREV